MAERTIRMNTTAAGPAGTFLAGQVVSVDIATADAWIAGGYADPVGDGPSPAKSAPPPRASKSNKSKAKTPAAEPPAEPASSDGEKSEPAEGDQSEGGDGGDTSGEE